MQSKNSNAIINNEIIYALIYTRVSSEKQVIEGHGAEAQEYRCKQRAEQEGYVYGRTFRDDAVSGATLERSGINSMLKYIDENPFKNFVVIFDDLQRLARDVQVYFNLKEQLKKRQVEIMCLSFEFSDTDEGEFFETISVASGQLQRKQNRRQVMNKMNARLEAGYWSFAPKSGYVMIKDSIHGKLLYPDETIAPIYKDAIEQYRDGVFLTVNDVRDFIQQEFNDEKIKRKMSADATKALLTDVTYAGYIEYQEWGVQRCIGHHRGIIDLQTFDVVQARLQGRKLPSKRKDRTNDFPLRRFVSCSECGVSLTASWNKGRRKYYANYRCKNKNCSMHNKHIAKEKIELEFEKLLESVKPSDRLLNLANAIMNERWALKEQQHNSEQVMVSRKTNDLQEQADGLLRRLAKATDDSITDMYESEVIRLKGEIANLNRTKSNKQFTNAELGTASQIVTEALKNPNTMWKSDTYTDQRTLLLMYFEQGLTYSVNTGFGTATLSYPLALIKGFENEQSLDVHRLGFEPR